jgi:hypothetical protein
MTPDARKALRAVLARCALAIALFLGAFFGPAAVLAVQNELIPPTSGIYTGVQYSQKIGDAFRSLASCNKGATAPANVSGLAVDGLCWIDDSASPWIIKQYVNGGWAIIGALDPTDSSYAGVIGGGAPGSIASSTGPVINLGTVPQANVTITGTSDITGFGSSVPAGVIKIVRFAATLKLTNSSALAVPGGFDLTTAANDRAIVTHLGSGNWEITIYTRASGIPVDIAAVGKADFSFAESVPALHVAGYGQALARASYPAYLAKVTRTQSGTRVSGNATLTSVANTDGLGAGMPVEGTGIGAGCTIASVTSSTITLNSSSCVTSSGTANVTVFPTGYGSGGDSTTVGVKDCRGRGLAGRDRSDPGSLAGRLTSSYFGANSGVLGNVGGGESATLTLAQLPTGITVSGSNTITVYPNGNPINLFGTSPGGTVVGIGAVNSGANAVPASTAGNWIGYSTASGSNTITGTSTNTSGSAHAIVPPTLIAECIVRVIP